MKITIFIIVLALKSNENMEIWHLRLSQLANSSKPGAKTAYFKMCPKCPPQAFTQARSLTIPFLPQTGPFQGYPMEYHANDTLWQQTYSLIKKQNCCQFFLLKADWSLPVIINWLSSRTTPWVKKTRHQTLGHNFTNYYLIFPKKFY